MPPFPDDNPAIRTLAGLFAREREEAGLSPGDRAELRRMNPEGILPPACWRLLVTLDLQPKAERVWAVLFGVMEEASGPGARPIGAALASAAGPPSPGERPTTYAEQRFVKLLRARGIGEVAHEARQAARWCAAQGAALRFDDEKGANGFGPFILAAAQGRESQAEQRAQSIARDYFTTLHRAAKAKES